MQPVSVGVFLLPINFCHSPTIGILCSQIEYKTPDASLCCSGVCLLMYQAASLDFLNVGYYPGWRSWLTIALEEGSKSEFNLVRLQVLRLLFFSFQCRYKVIYPLDKNDLERWIPCTSSAIPSPEQAHELMLLC